MAALGNLGKEPQLFLQLEDDLNIFQMKDNFKWMTTSLFFK
jgi:hypothetical protein